MIAGPNGSGKSTLIRLLQRRGFDFGKHFNADVIARDLGPPSEEVSRQAQAAVREHRDRCLVERVDYSWETVMSHGSHIDHLSLAAEQGYDARLFYVATEDPQVNIGRVADRVVTGEHDVPRDRIIERYAKSLALLPRAVLTSDTAQIFDNSDEVQPFREIAALDEEYFETHENEADLPLWFRPVLNEIMRYAE